MTLDLNLGHALFTALTALIGALWQWVRSELQAAKAEHRDMNDAIRSLEMKVADKHPTKEELQAAVLASEARHVRLEQMLTDLAAQTSKIITRIEVLVAREEMDQRRQAPKRRA